MEKQGHYDEGELIKEMMMASNLDPNGQSRWGYGRYLRRGAFILDLVDQCAIVNQKAIQIPRCVFECLVMLVRNSPNPVSFQDLAQASSGLALSQVDVQDHARMHIYILKKAFELNQESSRRIQAVPGVGYKIKT
jgi:DNA-binding winged helix-turn-helix (wHTH) protein